MKCHDIHQTLIAYLDNEATPLEQKQLREHVAGCTECQAEMADLQKFQRHLHHSMKVEAAQVVPSPDTWRRLQSRLAAEPVMPSSRGNGLLRHLNLLSFNLRRSDRINNPSNDTSPDLSWIITPTVKHWWNRGLVWAARWSDRSGMRIQSKTALSIHNKQAKALKDGNSEESVE